MEQSRALLHEKEHISLPLIISTSPDKAPAQRLDTLISRLFDIQIALAVAYRNDTVLKFKLLNAMKDAEV